MVVFHVKVRGIVSGTRVEAQLIPTGNFRANSHDIGTTRDAKAKLLQFRLSLAAPRVYYQIA